MNHFLLGYQMYTCSINTITYNLKIINYNYGEMVFYKFNAKNNGGINLNQYLISSQFCNNYMNEYCLLQT